MAIQRRRDILGGLSVKKTALNMLESYRCRAICSLSSLDNPVLKGLLRRVISKIFNDIDVMGCCNDYTHKNAGINPGGSTTSG